MKRMLVILVLALAASSPALSQGNDGRDQGAQEVSVQISSIPAGLNLYVASADDKALAEAESKTRDMLTKESYLRGATPARLSLASGKYYVTVAPVLGLPERPDLMLICEDPALKREEYLVVSNQPTIDAIKTDPKGKPVVGLKSFAAPLYSFEITPDGARIHHDFGRSENALAHRARLLLPAGSVVRCRRHRKGGERLDRSNLRSVSRDDPEGCRRFASARRQGRRAHAVQGPREGAWPRSSSWLPFT